MSGGGIMMAEKILGTLEGKSILVIGAGKMGELAMGHIRNKAFANVYVMNRTQSIACELAGQFNARAVGFCDIKEILAVKGIDVAQIAPFDLSASLGRPGQIDHPEVKKAIATAERAILKSGVVLGGLGQTVENTKKMIARGYRAILITHDRGLIQATPAAILGPLKGSKSTRSGY